MGQRRPHEHSRLYRQKPRSHRADGSVQGLLGVAPALAPWPTMLHAPSMSASQVKDTPVDRECDRPHALQIQAWRTMGAAGRTRIGIELRRQARRWKLSALRSQNPDWTEERLRTELAKIYLRGRT